MIEVEKRWSLDQVLAEMRITLEFHEKYGWQNNDLKTMVLSVHDLLMELADRRKVDVYERGFIDGYEKRIKEEQNDV